MEFSNLLVARFSFRCPISSRSSMRFWIRSSVLMSRSSLASMCEPSPFHKHRRNGQLVRSQAKCLSRERPVDPSHSKQYAPRLNHCPPHPRTPFPLAHTVLRGFFVKRLVGKDPNPPLPPAFEERGETHSSR